MGVNVVENYKRDNIKMCVLKMEDDKEYWCLFFVVIKNLDYVMIIDVVVDDSMIIIRELILEIGFFKNWEENIEMLGI